MRINKLRLAIKTTAASVIAMGLAGQPAMAQSEDMETRLNNLERQIERMKAGQAADSGVKIPGTDTTISLSGYVKLDMIYDSDQDLGDSLDPTVLDTGSDGGDPSFRMHARQSRLRLGTVTPTSAGEVETTIEVDFYGGGGNELFSNSRGLRLRHAYGELGGFLAGQTWSNFMQFTAYPTTVDFNGPVGVSFIRQAQVRYTMPVSGGAFSVSAENPETSGFEESRDVLPDLTARYKWSNGGGGFEVSGLARQLRTDSALATGDDSTFGYGVSIAGRIDLTDSTSLMASAVFGDGIGRYLYSSFSNDDSSATRTGVGEAYISPNGDLEAIEAFGYNVAASHQWTPKFTSSLSYGVLEGDQPGDLFPVSFETLQSVHFSNFYQVVEPLVLGVELSYADKELKNGESADNTRLQLAAQYSF